MLWSLNSTTRTSYHTKIWKEFKKDWKEWRSGTTTIRHTTINQHQLLFASISPSNGSPPHWRWREANRKWWIHLEQHWNIEAMFETSPPYLGISVVMIMFIARSWQFTHTHTPSTNKAVLQGFLLWSLENERRGFLNVDGCWTWLSSTEFFEFLEPGSWCQSLDKVSLGCIGCKLWNMLWQTEGFIKMETGST